MDVMPKMNGIEALKAIMAEDPSAKVLCAPPWDRNRWSLQ